VEKEQDEVSWGFVGAFVSPPFMLMFVE
jgi:predicted PurR-regulated permease PerM